jgi:hypothetical protein
MSHFEVDVNSERGKALIKSFLEDPDQISLDSYFAEQRAKLSAGS